MKQKHLGGDFDAFLEKEGILEEVEAASAKRVIAFQIAQRAQLESDLRSN